MTTRIKLTRLRSGFAALFIAALLGGMLMALPAPSFAQDNAALPNHNVSINLQNGDVRSALDALFKGSGLNYAMDPGVTGTITISLRDVPFDVALRSILRAANPPLTYSVQDGIYQIKPRNTMATNPYTPATTTPGEPQPTGTMTVVPIRLNYADARLLLFQAFGGGPVIEPELMGRSTGSMGGSTGGMGGGMGSMGGMGGGMSMGGMGGGMNMGGMGGGMNMGGGMGGGGGMVL